MPNPRVKVISVKVTEVEYRLLKEADVRAWGRDVLLRSAKRRLA